MVTSPDYHNGLLWARSGSEVPGYKGIYTVSTYPKLFGWALKRPSSIMILERTSVLFYNNIAIFEFPTLTILKLSQSYDLAIAKPAINFGRILPLAVPQLKIKRIGYVLGFDKCFRPFLLPRTSRIILDLALPNCHPVTGR